MPPTRSTALEADDNAKNMIAQLDARARVRDTHESTWRDIKNFIQPIASSFTTIDQRGRVRRDEILDNSAEGVSEELAAAVAGFLSNPGTNWHGLKVLPEELNDDAEVAIWLEICARRMLRIYEHPDSKFYPGVQDAYNCDVDFGTGTVWIGDRPGKVPLYQFVPLAQQYLAENEAGEIDSFLRKFQFTARQAVQRWGKAVPEKIGQAAEDPKKQEDQFWFLHVHEPRADGNPDALRADELPWKSDWISVDFKKTMRVGGTSDKSMIAGRWKKRDQDVYGRGCGHKALHDVKMLQRTMMSVIRGAEKAIDPPTMVADDGILSPVRGGARGITIVKRELLVNSRQSPVQPFPVNADPQLGEAFADGVRARVARAYYNHLIELSQDPRMTATHVLKLDERMLKTLNPYLGNLQSELLGGIVRRTFDICLRRGLFPPMPAKLAEAERIDVTYESAVARAARLGEAIAVSQYYELTNSMRALNPEIDDNIDTDGAARLVAERVGMPRALLVDPKKVAEKRQARQEAQQREQQLEEIERLAPAAQSAGQAMAAFKDAGGGGEAVPQAANAA